MNHDEQLRQAFLNHEHLAPSPAEVSAGALELARGYRRRRAVAYAAGGALVTAGMGAAAVMAAGQLGGASLTTDRAVPFAAAPGAPTATLADPQEQREAFRSAGYDYDDAVELARLWGLRQDAADDVKAEAGRRLLAGERLPLAAGAGPAAPAPAPPDLEAGPGEDPYVAFLNAGYDWNDAVELARLWGSSDVLQTKADAGRKLLNGETLPIAP